MASSRISVIMTLYNKGAFVEEAIQSVLANSHTDFELLVLDDGSTDDGPGIVRRMVDARIRLLPGAQNEGRAHAANRGFDAATGEYIAILDADDLMRSDRLSKQAGFLDAHPNVGVCGSAAQVIGERDRIASWPATDEEARGLLLFEDPLLYGSCMLRRRLLLDHGLRCPEDWHGPGMDYLFLLRLSAVTRVANLPEPLTSYRIGPNNFRHGRDREADTERIVSAALDRFGISHSVEDLRAHLVLLRRASPPKSADEARAVNAWLSRLRLFNASAHAFTPDVFEQRLRAEEEHLFCVLADRDRRLARLHARLSGGWSWRRLRYLLSAAFKRVRHSSTLPTQ